MNNDVKYVYLYRWAFKDAVKYVYIYRLSKPNVLPTSHHQPPPPPPTPPPTSAGLPRGGSCFLPRLLAKIPPFLSLSGGSILYESERNFFYRFLPFKMLVLGFRRGKTLPASSRPWCPPFCARVSAFFLQIFIVQNACFGVSSR